MASKPLKRAAINPAWFNAKAVLPYNLRLSDFESAMRDVYDFLSDTNQFLVDKGLPRLDETLRPAPCLPADSNPARLHTLTS